MQQADQEPSLIERDVQPVRLAEQSRGVRIETAIRILHLEDNVLDAELIQATLAAGAVEVNIHRVTGHAEFRQALDEGSFDVILADYDLPDFYGTQALALAQKQCPEVPFLFVSGVIDEDMAIESVKQGATDYVFKTRLRRLVPAVLRALHESQQHREKRLVEEALRKSEERYRQLLETSPDMVFQVDQNERFLYLNPVAAQALGQAPEQVLGRRQSEFLSAETAIHYSELIQTVFRTGTPLANEIPQPFGQQPMWTDLRLIPLKGPQEEVASVLGIARDITARKKAEEERERLIRGLQAALAKVKMLSGLVPICAACKKIRDDQGYWNQLELYIQAHSEAQFTHGLCPQCAQRLYPEVFS